MFQSLRKDAYDHFTAIYYLLLDKLKLDRQRALSGDQVMVMPVCVSLVTSLVTAPTCCHDSHIFLVELELKVWEGKGGRGWRK